MEKTVHFVRMSMLVNPAEYFPRQSCRNPAKMQETEELKPAYTAREELCDIYVPTADTFMTLNRATPKGA